MFEFLTNIFYWLFLGAILILTRTITHNAFSKEVLSKQPNALLWNNSFIILDVVFIIIVFVWFSWVAGILTLILAFIVAGITGRRVERIMINNIIKLAKPKNKSK